MIEDRTSSGSARRRPGLYVELLLVCALAAPAVADDDHEEAWRLREAGTIMPLEQLLERVRADHPGRVIGVELEHEDGRRVYEIELLDEEGRVRELLFDAADGEFLGED